MARLLRALAALLLLAAAAVAEDGWFPPTCCASVRFPQRFYDTGGGFRAARESR